MRSSRAVPFRALSVLGVALLAVVLAAGISPGASTFLTKQKAKKLFYTKGQADAQFINVGEQASDSANVTCNGCVSAVKLAPSEPWREVGASGQPAFSESCTLAPCWENYGSPFNTAGFYKDPFGVVHLKGLVLCNPAVGSGCNIGPIFVLPPGYRPAGQGIFAQLRDNAPVRVEVVTDGAVHMNSNTGSGSWISLEGITFRAV